MMEVYEVMPILIFQGLFFLVKHLRFFFLMETAQFTEEKAFNDEPGPSCSRRG